MNKIAVIYYSHHHNNTEKLLKECSNEIEMDLYPIEKSDTVNLDDYNFIGFASGIYHNEVSNLILKYIENNKDKLSEKNVFLITTSGTGTKKPCEKLATKLKEDGCIVRGIFACKCYDTFGPFKLIGGINKKHPNEKDQENMVSFMKQITQIIQIVV